jgi:two-component system cell cycle response regulator DivK
MSQVSGRDYRSRPPHIPFALGEESPAEKAPRARPMVLLVDDIEDCRDVYGQFLRHTGYEVVEAADGHEALAKAAALRPDAIVMDLWMPHLDGWESIRHLKSTPATADIPVLVLTGDAYAQARRDAESAGCQAYLVKPCLPMDVAAQVGRLLVDARAGAAPPVRVLSERRSGGRRLSESGGGLLASVVADVERRHHEVTRQLELLEAEVRTVAGDKADTLQRHLGAVQETRKRLAQHIDALKVITRSADVKITIPAKRGSRKP